MMYLDGESGDEVEISGITLNSSKGRKKKFKFAKASSRQPAVVGEMDDAEAEDIVGDGAPLPALKTFRVKLLMTMPFPIRTLVYHRKRSGWSL